MNEMSQLASAMATLVFAAGMLIAEQLYIESRSANASIPPIRAAQNLSREGMVFRTGIRPVRSIRIPQRRPDY
jgi:hypothetical protein